MRGLITHDIFAAAKIVKAAGVKEKFKEIALAIQDNKLTDAKEIGFEFILDLIASAGDEKTEKAVMEFLSGPLEMKPEEISAADPLALIEELKKLRDFIDMDAWRAFFKSLAFLIK